MDFLSLQKALDRKKAQKAKKKEFTPECIDALEYFASMEKEHNELFDEVFNSSGTEVLDIAIEMFDMVDIQSASVPLSFAEIADLI